MQNSKPQTEKQPAIPFTKYESFIIGIISFIQFTVILDFMVLSPLGTILIPELKITTSEFGLVVSAYAFSAGISGLLAAGFADKYDRKKLLMFFYYGFVGGTIFCAIAPNYELLLTARIVTGIFGGVIASISMAIITDLFKMEVRGRVMGFVQMAFAASQVLGLPIGLALANSYKDWHASFWLIVILSVIVGVVMFVYMKPITEHLKLKSERNAFDHLWKTLTNSNYMKGFAATTLLATGGYMLMPLGSTFATNNLKLSLDQLPILYGITGGFTIAFGPLTGFLSDKIGKFKVFILGSIIGFITIGIYCNLAATPFEIVVALNTLLFAGITARIITSGALQTAMPMPQDRGAYMSINSSVQQIAGGIASIIAGMIVVQTPNNGPLENYDILGYVVMGSITVAVFLFNVVDNQVRENLHKTSNSKIV
jgi:predicted MFS family arabinose efflux permease